MEAKTGLMGLFILKKKLQCVSNANGNNPGEKEKLMIQKRKRTAVTMSVNRQKGWDLINRRSGWEKGYNIWT